MQNYEVNQIHHWLYSIKEMGAYCYLIIGQEKALLFDTGFGIMNLRELVEKLTDKPYTVLLGHGHIDHVNGAPQFDSVMLKEADLPVYHEHSSEEYRKNALEAARGSGINLADDYDGEGYVKQKQTNIKPLDAGMSFDLGGLNVDVINMQGHTPGSVGLLVREQALLLTSDSTNAHVWLFLHESLSLNEYISMLERVITLPFDTFVCGHNDELMDKSVFQKYLNAAKNADVAKSEPYEMFGISAWIYKEDGAEVVFK